MADGYARASGKVGVALATSGPGATNLVTGIATAMLDSIPIVCITGQVSSQLLGIDAFQETDITGVTLPITKHNYPGHARRGHRADACARRSPSRAAGGRARCSSTSPRTRSRRPATSRCDGRAGACRGYRPEHDAGDRSWRSARGDDRRRRAAVCFCGHGIIAAGAEPLLLAFVEKTRHPGRRDAARPRRLPGDAPAGARHDGHARRGVGQHAIQEADLIDRARHALRRPRHRQSRRRTRQARRRSTSSSTRPRSTRTSRVDVPLVGDVREPLPRAARRGRRARAATGWRARDRDAAGRRGACATSRRSPTTTGHLYARARDRTTCGASPTGKALVVTDVGPAPDVGSAVLQARRPAEAHHLGRPRHDGLRAAGGDRRALRAARRRDLGHRRRRRLPDDRVRAVDLRAGGHQGQRRHHQQRLPRHGAAVAAVLLRRPLRGDADQEPGLREARRGARPRRAARAPSARRCDGGRGGARAHGHRRHRLPRRARGQRLPDGAGGRRPRRHDPPPATTARTAA